MPASARADSFFVYLLRCADDSLYVGHTSSVDDRLKAHNEGRGALRTACRRPVVLAYSEVQPSEEQAVARERQIKRWTHAKKLALLNGESNKIKSLARRRIPCFPRRKVLPGSRRLHCLELTTLLSSLEMFTPKTRVAGFSISVDGFGAGPNQSMGDPLGQRGPELFEWFRATRTFCNMLGKDGGETGIDDDYAARSMSNFGAFILGRNMFGPVRGPWPNDEWKGWWGENPPYHAPTFILTHHARAPITMQGGTRFFFVTDGIDSALRQAREAAGEKDVKIGGGVATVRQYLEIDAIDEIHLAISPVVLGRGEKLLSGIDLARIGFKVIEHAPTARATHIVLSKS